MSTDDSKSIDDINTTISIDRDDGRRLEFEGRLVCQSEGSRVRATGYDRWHNLRLYATAEGMLVPLIEFHSNCPAEKSAVVSDFVDNIGEVEKFFYVYEPVEHINPKTLREMKNEEKHRFTNSLYADYHLQLNGILLASCEFAAHEPVTTTDDSQQVVSGNRLSRLFEFLGLK